MTSRLNARLGRTLLLGLILAACAVVAPTAGAAEQSINVCSDGTQGFWDWSADPFNPIGPEDAWRLTSACPGVLTLSSVTPTGGQWSDWWQLPSYPDYGRLHFTKASFTLSGSDGSDGGAGNRSQGVALCSASACGPLIRPSGPDVLQPEYHEFQAGDGFMPDQTDQIRVVGSCDNGVGAPSSDPCVPGRPLYIWGIVLTFEDDDSPVVTLADPGDNPPAPPVVVDGWNGIGDHSLSVNAQDAAAGVHHLQFMFNATKGQNGVRYYTETGCGSFENFDPSDHPCTQSTDVTYKFNSQTFGVQEGDNTLDYSAFDGAGNQSERHVIHFKLDRTRPIAAGLVATTSFMNGWQSDPVVNLRWSNGADAYETKTNSPVVRARAVAVKYGSSASSATRYADGANVNSLDGIKLPGPGLWRIRFNLWDGAGNISDYQEIQVGVDSTVAGAPEVKPLAQTGSTQIAAGVRAEWTPPPPTPAGTCGYSMSVDQSPASDPGTEIEYPASAVSAPLPRALPDGDNFVHLRAISCAGVPGQIANVRFQVDAVVPEIAVSAPSSSGWYDDDAPLVARVADEPGVRLGFSVDDSPVTWIDAADTTVPLIDGTHSVIVRASDAWGNQSQRALRVSFDGSPPRAEFDLFDASDPTVVRAVVRDAGSGVSAAMLQYRRIGDSDWTGFGAPVYSAGEAPAVLTVAQRFPDQLVTSGVYDLRLIAFDVSGHHSSTSARSDGSPATLILPLRAAANIKAGFAVSSFRRKCGRGDRRVCKTARAITVKAQKVVAFGATAPLQGELRDATGNPVPGSRLKVFDSVLGGPRRLVGTVVTDGAGAFQFTPQPGPSRLIVVRFDGSSKLAPAEAEVRLLTTGKVLFERLPGRVRGGVPVVLAGRVVAPGVSIPPDLNVEFQYFARGAWQKFLVAGAVVDVNGEFSAALRFPVTNQPVIYRLRARVQSPQSGWPYETGVSVMRKLVVVR